MIDTVSINGWAVLAAVFSSFVVGGIWYSPGLFLKPWLAMSEVDKRAFDAGMPKALLGDLVASIAMAIGLTLILNLFGATDARHGVLAGFLIWLGFVAPALIHSVTYEHRPVAYFAINAGHRLVVLVIMGAILAIWQ